MSSSSSRSRREKKTRRRRRRTLPGTTTSAHRRRRRSKKKKRSSRRHLFSGEARTMDLTHFFPIEYLGYQKFKIQFPERERSSSSLSFSLEFDAFPGDQRLSSREQELEETARARDNNNNDHSGQFRERIGGIFDHFIRVRRGVRESIISWWSL